ncbi:PREDICTED: uncharacterized protein LOC109181020 [Ipomoea nil]|uniref:uncharacterized protein LOC109181020 n=1 Tax=Ipomoea nil TaxID=35883 RepID=UPI0009013BD0|nr:PREDICTED: uncharacterized protein LOC109181020 [Ipomoea nil]
MARVEMAHAVDLECGGHGGGDTSDGEEEGSVYFSDADEGSCHSQLYSTADGSELEIEEALESRRASSDCSVDLESGVGETKPHLGKLDRDCRICHLSLQSPGPQSGVAIELGCSCKDDLAAAHKHCAETWFKIKGNKVCEICNSIVRNLVGPNDVEPLQPRIETNDLATNGVSAVATSSAPETRNCLNGHWFLNFLLACMVFAFVISWLFHFNIPS